MRDGDRRSRRRGDFLESRQRRTIAQLWRNAVAAGRQGPAYLVETDDGWNEVSWADADERVRAYANGLLARGVRKGDNFALLARNSLDWALVDFALAQIGAVGIPVYASSAPRDVEYLLAHSEAVGIVCEDAEQLAKVEAATGELPALQHVLTYHDLDGLATHGRDFATANPSALDEATAAIGEDDLFTIIYTSGTTGPPKGCMLSNRNYFEMASVVDRMEETYYREDDVMLLYLPLAHNYGRLMLLLGAHVGFTIAFLADPLRVAEALPKVRPTLLPSVPRVYEKVHTAVLAKFDAATGVKRRLIDWALPIGREVSRLEGEGKPIPRRLRTQASPRRPARLQQGARAVRRPPAHAGIGRRPLVEGDHRVLRRRSASASRRATVSRSARRRRAPTAPTSTASAR